jgi:hypothetical protein
MRIEIVLRESLKAALESEFGVQWQKRLPGSLLKKIKESQAEENRPQFNFIRLGPLYYLTFAELLPLLQQKAGRSVIEKLGGDCFSKQFENLFTPRNAICHSRPVSTVGLMAIEALYHQMKTALSEQDFDHLLSKLDIGLAQDEAAKKLIPAFKNVIENLPNLPISFEIPEEFQIATDQFWWADDSLAGFNRSIVELATALVREYNALPAGVGCAGIRQTFSEQRHIKASVQHAITELEKVKI